MWKVIGGVVVVIFALAAIGSNVQQRAGVETASVEEPEACVATLAEFNRLHTGMSLNQVKHIIGCEGVEQGRNTLPMPTFANGRVYEDTLTTVMYQWPGNSMLSGVDVMFQNDSLMSKTQIGLQWLGLP